MTWRARLGDRVRDALRSVLLARAHDATADLDAGTCVVVAPHPDDETIGCGATIARKVAGGARVVVVFVSDGSRSHRSESVTPQELARLRLAESHAALAALGDGIEAVHLALPDGVLADHEHQITEQLREILRRERPAEVLSPSLDEPPSDHWVVGRATRAAVAAAPSARVLEYGVWMWSRWPLPGPARGGDARSARSAWVAVSTAPVIRVATAGEPIERKRAALAAYVTQTTQFRDDPDWAPLPESFVARHTGPYELLFPVAGPARPATP